MVSHAVSRSCDPLVAVANSDLIPFTPWKAERRRQEVQKRSSESLFPVIDPPLSPSVYQYLARTALGLSRFAAEPPRGIRADGEVNR
jgi:hypothetical protein